MTPRRFMGPTSTFIIARSLAVAIFAAGCARAEPRAAQPAPAPGAAAAAESGGAPVPGTASDDLQIALAVSPKSAGPGQEIELRVTYRNVGDTAYRLLEDTTFVGSELVVQRAGGEQIDYEGGYLTFSPKQGVFPGRTFLLEAGAERTLVLPAWVDGRYRLLFTNTPEAELGIGPSELKTRLGAPAELPARYVSAGRIFPVGQAGPVTLRFRYERGERDREWIINAGSAEESSLDDLWIGRAESNPVELELQ